LDKPANRPKVELARAESERFSSWRALFRAVEYCVPVLPYPMRVRVGIRRDGSVGEYGVTVALLPLVGAAFGLLGAAALFPLERAWPRPVAISAIWLAWLWANSAKIDCIADFFDGFALKRNAEKTLEIMTDPRIGSIGGLGMISVLVAGLVCLLHLPAERWVPAVVSVSALAK